MVHLVSKELDRTLKVLDAQNDSLVENIVRRHLGELVETKDSLTIVEVCEFRVFDENSLLSLAKLGHTRNKII